MDTIKSFKGYGKVDEVIEQQQAFRQKTRKRIILIVASAILLLAIVIAIVVGTLVHNSNNRNSSSSSSSSSSSIRSVCSVTQYQESCISSLQSLDTTSTTTDPQQLFKLSLLAVLHELTHLSASPSNIKSKINDDRVKAALDVCQIVIDDAIDRINDSISAMEQSSSLSNEKVEDLKTWLSTTLTDQETCFDSLEEVNATTVLDQMKELAKNSTQFSSNSLAIVSKILGILSNFNIPPITHHRRRRRSLLQQGMDIEEDVAHIYDRRSFPRWVERRFLQETKPTPNLVVAKDGSGNYTTIGEAVAKIPKKSATRFVIYIKAGEYVENINMNKSMWNVMMYGDGMASTIVSGSFNKIDGIPTFNTATFAVVGKGFIARDMGFKNSAGPVKEQAVALRSGSDQSVFYRCSFDGFQDTLYAHSNRQFYRECDITGTVDFIFGNSAMVLQNCNIQPRQPGPNQVVTITAQGKKDVNQNTGISVQKCKISPSVMTKNLTARTYLGRPWKEYSTTIIMQSEIGSFLDPAGWSPWVPGVVPPSTIFYAEYLNTGPGASLENRVTWDGYRRNTTAAQASKFTVESFIDGTMWLPQTQVLFDLTL